MSCSSNSKPKQNIFNRVQPKERISVRVQKIVVKGKIPVSSSFPFAQNVLKTALSRFIDPLPKNPGFNNPEEEA